MKSFPGLPEVGFEDHHKDRLSCPKLLFCYLNSFNVAAIFWAGHPYIWCTTIHHNTPHTAALLILFLGTAMQDPMPILLPLDTSNTTWSVPPTPYLVPTKIFLGNMPQCCVLMHVHSQSCVPPPILSVFQHHWHTHNDTYKEPHSQPLMLRLGMRL